MISFLTALLLLFVSFSPAHSADESNDPGDMFVRAYMIFQKAEKFTMAHADSDAVESYQKALEILTTIQTQYPEWQVNIVKYRKGRVEAALKRLTPATDA